MVYAGVYAVEVVCVCMYVGNYFISGWVEIRLDERRRLLKAAGAFVDVDLQAVQLLLTALCWG